ncbi:hypothetical protein DVQ05_04405 [Yersinia enterocolitica]|nr:hypothetical protein [Yersinia enterocolitica]QBP98658.1 hypothetical protein YEY1_07545 [Yersinia enterocolitica subsp. palearctica]EKN5957949.1 hypothetical protein [Yersinia enterocolitica]EKN5971009.1 hypothetical protein [Yersinia enterocolitica]EKN6017824.1 hypothetical protein [Yersinia enterocolitica]
MKTPSGGTYQRDSPHLSDIPFLLRAACALAAFVTRPVHGPRLCEAAASSVQICSGQICHPNHLLE